jgi:hypothetical protein
MLGDFYHHLEEAHALLGARSGKAYRLGDSVRVRFVQAIPTAGARRFAGDGSRHRRRCVARRPYTHMWRGAGHDKGTFAKHVSADMWNTSAANA